MSVRHLLHTKRLSFPTSRFTRTSSTARKVVNVPYSFDIESVKSKKTKTKKIVALNYKEDILKTNDLESVHESIQKAKPPTPLKKEVDAIQNQYKDHILLVQVGMFFEIYECAEPSYLDEIASICGLKIGVHKSGGEHRFTRFTGFPTFALRNHLETILEHGKTVAIVEQLPVSPTSHIITRKVTRIITPGTLLDELNINSFENNFLLAIYANPNGKLLGLSWLDVSTGEFYLSEIESKDLTAELTKIDPKEILIPDYLQGSTLYNYLMETNAKITIKSPDIFESQSSQLKLTKVILSNDSSKAVLGKTPKLILKGMHPLQIKSAGGLLAYLSENFPTIDPMVHSPLLLSTKNTMRLDPTTVKSLELFNTQNELQAKGSLFSVINTTLTGGGARLLRSRLNAPSVDINEIDRRLNLLSVFYNDRNLSLNVKNILSDCPDIERSLQRLHFQTGGPHDVYNTISALDKYDQIKRVLNMNRTEIKESFIESHEQFFTKDTDIEQLLKHKTLFNPDRIEKKLDAIGIISDGICKNLDKARHLQQKLLIKQDTLEKKLCESFNINCKLVFNDRVGPIVEIGKVSVATQKRIDDVIDSHSTMSLIGRSSNKNCTRFTFSEWSLLHEQISQNNETLRKMEQSIFDNVCDEIKSASFQIVKASQILSEIDIACTQGITAFEKNYNRPQMVTKAIQEIHAGRHPVVEKYQIERGNTFVTNDVQLNKDNPLILLTGPNMGGKSTYLRQSAVISIMAQAGLFVPCKAAKLGIIDQIFTRIGSSDDLAGHKSTFQVEMLETANILKNATESSLIIMDEVGRGTSTVDGISLAIAIISHIINVNQSLCVFATHYHELGEMIKRQSLDTIAFYQMVANVDAMQNIACMYKVVPGIMNNSFGILVAQGAGLPTSVIEEAKQQSIELMKQNNGLNI
ncbi:muts domain V-domain-containing protein [Globomyces pollinis-pini]|nr:muts domain V-domain-containing protein [Globomyces pollinis-pini]